MAEARTLRDEVKLAVQVGFNNIVVEGDNLTVIKAIKDDGQVPWKISNIIKDVQLWLNKDIQATFKHIFRKANMAADWLAKFGHSITGVFSSDCCFSPHFRQLIADDVVGRTLMRRGA